MKRGAVLLALIGGACGDNALGPPDAAIVVADARVITPPPPPDAKATFPVICTGAIASLVGPDRFGGRVTINDPFVFSYTYDPALPDQDATAPRYATTIASVPPEDVRLTVDDWTFQPRPTGTACTVVVLNPASTGADEFKIDCGPMQASPSIGAETTHRVTLVLRDSMRRMFDAATLPPAAVDVGDADFSDVTVTGMGWSLSGPVFGCE